MMPRDEGSVASLVGGGRCHGAAGELSAAAEARVWLWCEQAGPWAPRGAEARGPAARAGGSAEALGEAHACPMHHGLDARDWGWESSGAGHSEAVTTFPRASAPAQACAP